MPSTTWSRKRERQYQHIRADSCAQAKPTRWPAKLPHAP